MLARCIKISFRSKQNWWESEKDENTKKRKNRELVMEDVSSMPSFR